MRHVSDDEIRRMLEAEKHMWAVINAALTERVINFGLQHGMSLQEIQCLCPRKEDGSPDSLAGQVLDVLVAQEKKKN